jgi:F0F1-type ATP synthase assembly protein I
MTWLITKYFITAAMVVLVSEIAKRSDRLGGLIAALPLVTLLTLLWLYFEQQPAEKIANHAWYTFWYVLPTLPMFAVFPMLMARFGFWPTLALSVLITVVSFVLLSQVLKWFGVELW